MFVKETRPATRGAVNATVLAFCFSWRCREAAKPIPSARGLLTGYVSSNLTSASKKGAAHASTVTWIASRINHKP